MRIMNEVSYLNAHTDEINAIALDDPEIFKYPVAYIIEVDWWAITDSEAAALRALPAEGRVPDRGRLQAAHGFRGDFGGLGRRVGGLRGRDEARHARGPLLRHGRLARDLSLRSSRSRRLDIIPQAYINGRPIFRGLFEGQRSRKRLQVIVNYNTDISQYLGVVRDGPPAHRRHQRSLQARRELHRLRADSLDRGNRDGDRLGLRLVADHRGHFALCDLELGDDGGLVDTVDPGAAPAHQLRGAERGKHDEFERAESGWTLYHVDPHGKAFVRARADGPKSSEKRTVEYRPGQVTGGACAGRRPARGRR